MGAAKDLVVCVTLHKINTHFIALVTCVYRVLSIHYNTQRVEVGAEGGRDRGGGYGSGRSSRYNFLARVNNYLQPYSSPHSIVIVNC